MKAYWDLDSIISQLKNEVSPLCHGSTPYASHDKSALNIISPFTTRQLTKYTASSARAGIASFSVGINSFPYLADHAFQGMVVLPGSFYIEMALCVHRESLQATVGIVRNVAFLNPVILSDRDVMLTVGVQPLGEHTVQYTFQEINGDSAEPLASTPCARVEITSDQSRSQGGSKSDFVVKDFQIRAGHNYHQSDFYRRLSKNGNQYGPRFQCLREVWREGAKALGRLQVPVDETDNGQHHLHPILLDGVAQLLSTFLLEQGRTFILQGIEEINILSSDMPREVWVRTDLRPGSDSQKNGGVGDLAVFGESGQLFLRLQGVKFTYLDKTGTGEQGSAPKTEVVVASTFTAEPVEDSLRFWGDYLGLPIQVGFAPYNQVFQQLLSPESQLRRNKDGFNAILLNLRDWATTGHPVGLELTAEKSTSAFGTLNRHILPNGIEVAHLNRHETEYVYKEIFEDRVYLRHDIRLPQDATVIDIGANIGLFSLFVRSRSPGASVLSFEPSPIAFRALQANCAAYGPGLLPFNVGVSERRGSAALTFYEKSSVFSSFHSDEKEDRKAIQAVVANMVRSELGGTTESVDEYVDELMTDRLDRQTFDCPLLSISDIIRDNDLQRVHLLKVDAEKCELEILRGIDASHWPLIDQVVIEVHDRTRKMVEEVQEILSKQGFQCAVEEENFLTGSGLFNVYATRKNNLSEPRTATSPDATLRDEVQGKVDQFVQAMESFTGSASAPTILCVCPSGGRKSAQETVLDRQLVEIENHLLKQVRAFPQVHVIGSAEILARYPTADFHDSHADDAGHIPYTPEGFAAIGTSLFRKFAGLRRSPYKVIVLDCDNTLWQGVCGEEGPLGVVVTPAHRALQEFMIQQMDAGMLLCLCSKNTEADVWAVFENNPSMVLKRAHLVAWRINWTPKSENIRSLAGELNLGLESIIFVDDNPVECAEVQTNCPAALTLLLPPNPKSFPEFLDHTWAFDHLFVSAEDRTRTKKAQENVERENYRKNVSTLKDFIDGLQLQVEIFGPARDQVGRVSQLTLRTNQFNFTSIRRSESDIIRFLDQDAGRCLAVNVRDRFGDYGMVGLLLYRDLMDRYEVDTFLLSCRVLGRGVEHQILAELGRKALAHGKQWIDLSFIPTEKNQPAWEFIKTVGAEFMQPKDQGTSFIFPAAKMSAVRYEPDHPLADSKSTGENLPSEAGPSSLTVSGLAGLNEKIPQIANNLRDLKQLCAAIETYRLRASGFVEPAADAELPLTLEDRMLGIWRKAIGNPRIGLNDNFFDAGGTSLKAVQTIASIRRELKFNLSIINIFECPTVSLLCEKLAPGKTADSPVNQAMERGAKRKQHLRKRG